MSNVKLGFTGHDANLIHYVPSKWEKRWILSLRWCKQIDKHWVYSVMVTCFVLALAIIAETLDWSR